MNIEKQYHNTKIQRQKIPIIDTNMQQYKDKIQRQTMSILHKPAHLIVRLVFGFASDLSNSTKNINKE